jgi:hypothetical protein
MSRVTGRRAPVAALTLTTLSLAGLAGCGDDADTMSAAACDAYTDFQAAMLGDPAAVAPAVTALVDAVPSSLDDAAATLAPIGDDPAAIEDPAVTDALNAIGEEAYDSCDVAEQLDVSGIDYAFVDLPSEIDAGRVAIRFTNDSTSDEPHELVLAAPADGQSAAELAAMPIEELFAAARPMAVAFTDTPDQEATTMVDLEPGEYLVICTLPVGGFPASGGPAEDGPPLDPHSAHGMVTTLTVT